MLALLESLSLWHWLILGLILLSGEALGAAGFMLGLAAAAFLVALLLAVGLVHDWQYQLLLFAIFAVVATIIIWVFFRTKTEADQASLLNNRTAQLIGTQLTLAQAISNHAGRIQIGDTQWKVSAEEDLAAGTQVEIYASEGMTLKLRSVQSVNQSN